MAELWELGVVELAEHIRRRELSPPEVVRSFLERIDALEPTLRAWQAVDAEGALLADDIGRVEQMQASYERLCARMGIPTAALGQVNSSSRGDWRRYYDDTLAEGVATLYRRDLELFGYEF